MDIIGKDKIMDFEELSSKWQNEAIKHAIQGFEELYLDEGIEDFELNEDSEEVQEYIEDHIYRVVYDPYTRCEELIVESRY